MTTPDYVVDAATGCWVWQRNVHASGYGRIYVSGKAQQYAHRVLYERLRGPVPEGLELDHLCRNRACVNPDHLEAVTHAENMRRGVQAKLTFEEAREIGGSAEPNKALARRFGVDPATIRALKKAA